MGNYQRRLGKRPKHKFTTSKFINRPLGIALLLIAILGLIKTGISANTIKLSSVSPQPSISILAPEQFTTLSSTNLTARLNGYGLNQYQMFWYVDNGTWNWMGNSPDGADSKEAAISFANWNWQKPGLPYTITVAAVVNTTGLRYYSGVQIYVNQAQNAVATNQSSLTNNLRLYVSPNSNAAQTANSTTDPTMKRVMMRMAAQPTASWFGNWNVNVETDVNNLLTAAANVNQIPVMVLYNIPDRDCGGYSSGGAASPSAYEAWVNQVYDGLNGRPAIIIVEPDALAGISCLTSSGQISRYQLISYAVNKLRSDPAAKIYIDAGNPGWNSPTTIAQRLSEAGVANSNGFSLNVSNFYTTAQNIAYGEQISRAIGNKHFVIDTSRNGKGSDGQWCNPPGMALGQQPTANTGNPLVDYFLWIKVPGESDGTCNGGPAAGTWWPQYGEQLALNAGW